MIVPLHATYESEIYDFFYGLTQQKRLTNLIFFFLNKTSQTVQTTVSRRHLEKDRKQDNYPNSIWQIYNDGLFRIGWLIWSHTQVFKTKRQTNQVLWPQCHSQLITSLVDKEQRL